MIVLRRISRVDGETRSGCRPSEGYISDISGFWVAGNSKGSKDVKYTNEPVALRSVQEAARRLKGATDA